MFTVAKYRMKKKYDRRKKTRDVMAERRRRKKNLKLKLTDKNVFTSFENDVGFSVEKVSVWVVLDFLLSRNWIDLYRRQLHTPFQCHSKRRSDQRIQRRSQKFAKGGQNRGSGDVSPQRGPGVEPLWGSRGSPQKLETYTESITVF